MLSPTTQDNEYANAVSSQTLARLLSKTSSVLTTLELDLHWLTVVVHQIGLHSCSQLRVLKLDSLHARKLPDLPAQLEELYVSTVEEGDDIDDEILDDEGLEPLASISSLRALTHLRVLAIEYAERLKDLTPIEACKALESLSLQKCTGVQQWPDFNASAALTSLHVSGIDDTFLQDQLRPLRSLRELELSHCTHLLSLEGLHAPLLAGLSLSNCTSLSTLEDLRGSPELTKLGLQQCIIQRAFRE